MDHLSNRNWHLCYHNTSSVLIPSFPASRLLSSEAHGATLKEGLRCLLLAAQNEVPGGIVFISSGVCGCVPGITFSVQDLYRDPPCVTQHFTHFLLVTSPVHCLSACRGPGLICQSMRQRVYVCVRACARLCVPAIFRRVPAFCPFSVWLSRLPEGNVLGWAGRVVEQGGAPRLQGKLLRLLKFQKPPTAPE